MKDIFEQLIIDFHNAELPNPSRRDFVIRKLPPQVKKANVFIGMRRCGKTWSMYQQIHILQQSGIAREKILYINFEDDRLINMTSSNFQDILKAYFSLYPQYIESKDLHFFFDEIHEIDGWEKFIRRLLDNEHVALYLSGSSSKMLSREIASSLRGRTISQEVFPLSFNEYLWHHQFNVEKRLTSRQQLRVSGFLRDYLVFGGFPEVVSLRGELHRRLLQDYVNIVIYRDIVERHNVSNIHVVKEFLKFCIQNASSSISVNKIFNRFKSQGKKVGKNSLYQYLEYFEDAYCVFTIPLYAHSINRQSVNPKKIYVIDQGLITAYSIKPDFEEAARLENTVFCTLRRIQEEIFYYQTKTGKEVDFLTISPDNGSAAIYQVSVSIQDQDTRKREVNALVEAMSELSLNSALLITKEHSERIETPAGIIKCIPIQDWLFGST